MKLEKSIKCCTCKKVLKDTSELMASFQDDEMTEAACLECYMEGNGTKAHKEFAKNGGWKDTFK